MKINLHRRILVWKTGSKYSLRFKLQKKYIYILPDALCSSNRRSKWKSKNWEKAWWYIYQIIKNIYYHVYKLLTRKLHYKDKQ